MKYEVVIMPRAVADVALASAWYELQSPNLGEKFKLAFDEVLDRIDIFPLAHR